MPTSSPRAWPWSASSSPEPYPETAWIQTLRTLHPILVDIPQVESLDADELRTWLGAQSIELEDGSRKGLSDWMVEGNRTSLEDRMVFILQGELANPHRLVDLGISGMPIIPVRMDGVCRVWTDVIDGREVSPGIHHVTLARTEGWWETTWLGFPDREQILKMTEWLNDGRGTSWRWCSLAEGGLSLVDTPILSPSEAEMTWDGSSEGVSTEAPPLSGPRIDLEEVKAILFTSQGCYDNRGKLARCAHIKQRAFHDGMFRRGSAKQWNRILDVR